MSSLPEHEKLNRRTAQRVLVVTEKMGIEAEDLGSTTFRREDLQRGFEPDSCFYIQNKEKVRGEDRIDVAVDPPPDLVIEVVITSPSISKLPIYARLGVPEVWALRRREAGDLPARGRRVRRSSGKRRPALPNEFYRYKTARTRQVAAPHGLAPGGA